MGTHSAPSHGRQAGPSAPAGRPRCEAPPAPRSPAPPRRPPQPAIVAVLEDAAASHRAGPDHLTGPQARRVARRGRQEPGHPNCIPPVRESVRTSPFTRHTARMSRSAGNSSGDTRSGPSSGEVLALRRPKAHRHLLHLQIARRPVVHHGEPLDLSVIADHGRELQLVVEHLGVGRDGDHVAVGTPPPGWRSRRRATRTTLPAPPGRDCPGRCERVLRRRRSRGSTVAAWSRGRAFSSLHQRG